MTTIAGSRITLVTQYYWPEHVGIAPYSTGLAEHLAELGANVEVLTAMPHYPAWSIEPGYGRLRLGDTRRGVRIERLWHYIPRRQSAVRRAGYEASFLLHALLRRARPTDAVIGVIPSLSAGATARAYARRRHCEYGIVVQDLASQGAHQSGLTSVGALAKATGAVERWVLGQAARVAVVTERFMPHIESAGIPPDKIAVLRNWVEVEGASILDETEAGALRRSLGWNDSDHVVLHAGNMGLKQGLEFVVAAARRAEERRVPVRFVLMGDGSQRPMIERAAEGVPTIQFLPNLPRDRCNEIMSVADVLLVNERRTVIDMALPSKLTSYFVAGRPVVAAVTEGGTTAQEVTRAGGGLVVAPEDPDALLDAVLQLASDAELAARLARQGADYARDQLSATWVLRQAEEFVGDLLERSAALRRSIGRG